MGKMLMKYRRKLSSLVLALPLLGALTAAMSGVAVGQPVPKEGLWREGPHKLALTIEVGPNDDLVIRQASPNDCCGVVGALIGEAHPSGPGLWIGRHRWGGAKQQAEFWSRPGALLIRRISDDTIFIQFRDSKYQGGWTYRRDAQP
jgi:hypothetical protein